MCYNFLIMYCIFSCNIIYFLKFIIYKINSKMFKSGMVKLTGRENSDVMILMCGLNDVGWYRLLLER
jgi:hypothetical protein